MLREWLVLFIVLLEPNPSMLDIPLNSNGQNVCLVEERFNVTIDVKEEYSQQYRVTEWCFSMPPRCTKYNVRLATRIVPRVVEHSRQIAKCCDGYVANGDGCRPFCRDACRHGTCSLPNVCSCFPGFRGPLCYDICKKGTWGGNCTQKCECKNDAYCNPMNGACVCSPGWRGKWCNDPCDAGHFGYECRIPCYCDGNTCHHITGQCFYPTTEEATEMSTEQTSTRVLASNLDSATASAYHISDWVSSEAADVATDFEQLTSPVTSFQISTIPTTMIDLMLNSTAISNISMTSTDPQYLPEMTSSTTTSEDLLSPTSEDVFPLFSEDSSTITNQPTDTISTESFELSSIIAEISSTFSGLTASSQNNTTTPIIPSVTPGIILSSDRDEFPYVENMDEEDAATSEGTVTREDIAGLIVTVVLSVFGSLILLIVAASLAMVRRRKLPPPSPCSPPGTDIGLHRFYAEESQPVKTLLNPAYGCSEVDEANALGFNTFRNVDNRFQMELRDILEAEYDHPHPYPHPLSRVSNSPTPYDHLYDELNLPPDPNIYLRSYY